MTSRLSEGPARKESGDTASGPRTRGGKGSSASFIAVPIVATDDENVEVQQLESLREPMEKVRNTMERAESQSKLLLMMNKDMKDMFLVFTKLWILYQQKKNDESILNSRLMAIIEESNILTNEEMKALAQEQSAIMTEVQNINNRIDEEFFSESNPLFQSLASEEKLFLKNRNEERDTLLREKLANIGVRPASTLQDFRKTIPPRFLDFMQNYYQSQYTADQAQIIVAKLNPTMNTEFIKLDQLFNMPEFPIYLPRRMDTPFIHIATDMFYEEVAIDDFSSLVEIFSEQGLREEAEVLKFENTADASYPFATSSLTTPQANRVKNKQTITHLIRIDNNNSAGPKHYYVFCHKEISDNKIFFFLPRDHMKQHSVYMRFFSDKEIDRDRFAFEYHTSTKQTESDLFSRKSDDGIFFIEAPRERSKEWIDLYIRPKSPKTNNNHSLSLAPTGRTLDFIIACLFFYGKHVSLTKRVSLESAAASAYVSIPQRDMYKNGIFDPSAENQIFTEILEPAAWLQPDKVIETFINNFLRTVNKESFIIACQSPSLKYLVKEAIDIESMQSLLLPVWYYSNGVHKAMYPYFCYPTFILEAEEVLDQIRIYHNILNSFNDSRQSIHWNQFYNMFFGGRLNKFIYEYYSAETKGRFNQYVRLIGLKNPEDIMTKEMKELKIYIESCEDSPWLYKIFRIAIALTLALRRVQETESVSFRNSYENVCMYIAELRNYSRTLFEEYFQILFQPKTSVQDLEVSIKQAFEFSILKMKSPENTILTLFPRYLQYLLRDCNQEDRIYVENIIFAEAAAEAKAKAAV